MFSPLKQNVSKTTNLLLPLVVGISIWLIFYFINGKTDPQSFDNYWIIGYPIFVVVAFLVTLLLGVAPILFAVLTMSSQILLGLFCLQGDLNQLPIGLAVHGVVSIPVILSGYGGSWVRKKYSKAKS